VRQYNDATDIVCQQAVASVDCRNLYENGEISGTLQSKSTGGHSLNYQNPIRAGYVIRRLTPTECERLMSFDDGYTAIGHDGKVMSDSARYQMLGNSIVVNVLAYIMQNVAKYLGADKTAR
jgi:DNA (cytosine-5)-methyltransferase 1